MRCAAYEAAIACSVTSSITTCCWYDITTLALLAVMTLSCKYALKIDTTQHVVPGIYIRTRSSACRHCHHNEDLNPGVFVGEEAAIWLQFIFLELIHFLPEGIDGSKPLAPQVKALAAAAAQATKTKTLDFEGINAGISTLFICSNQAVHF